MERTCFVSYEPRIGIRRHEEFGDTKRLALPDKMQCTHPTFVRLKTGVAIVMGTGGLPADWHPPSVMLLGGASWLATVTDQFATLMLSSSDHLPNRLPNRLVILCDDDFAWFARYGLAINARNVLDTISGKGPNDKCSCSSRGDGLPKSAEAVCTSHIACIRRTRSMKLFCPIDPLIKKLVVPGMGSESESPPQHAVSI